MAEPNREEIRAWLRGALKKLEETPTGLARRAGVAQSTLTRFLNSDEAPMLGLRTITKIAHAADINPIGMPSSEVQTPVPQVDLLSRTACLIAPRARKRP